MTRFNTAIARAAFSRPWALRPDRLAALAEVVRRWDSGARLSSAERAAAIERNGTHRTDGTHGQPKGQDVFSASHASHASHSSQSVSPSRPPAGSASSIAVINLFGILGQRMNMMDEISGPGGTSTRSVFVSDRRRTISFSRPSTRRR